MDLDVIFLFGLPHFASDDLLIWLGFFPVCFILCFVDDEVKQGFAVEGTCGLLVGLVTATLGRRDAGILGRETGNR